MFSGRSAIVTGGARGIGAAVAAMVRFIVAEATFSTGSEFVVDGGATAGQVLNVAGAAQE